MEDEFFEEFVISFGFPNEIIVAKPEEIEIYRGALPNKLLEYWGVYGFSGFGQGLFWLTNPAEFDDIVKKFLAHTIFDGYDNYHVIARNAYGELYLWGERTGWSLTIKPSLNWIVTEEGAEKSIAKKGADYAIQFLFYSLEKEYIDMQKSNKYLFPSVLKKFGAIGKDDVIVFHPHLFLGGSVNVKNMTIEKLDVFMQIVLNFGDAEVIDMASLVSEAINKNQKK